MTTKHEEREMPGQFSTEMGSARTWRQVNLWLSVVWALMVPVAIMTGWLYSIAFISACSIYANFASHVAAWRADVPADGEREKDH